MSNLERQFSGRRVLITGGLGFIGSNLAARLIQLDSVVTLVDSLIPQYGGNLFNVTGLEGRVRINVCDVRDPFALAYLLEKQDFLFNLAGQTSHIDSIVDPRTDLDINATAQLSILEACRKVNPSIRIVFASTRQIYGRPQYLPVDEKHPLAPVDVNGINKIAGESYHLLYHRLHGIWTCALRLTNTYGPRMRVKDARQTFLGVWIRRLIEGLPIQVFGDGCQLRDFNYVDDCVDAMLRAAASEQAAGKAYNLGSGEVVSLGDLAEMLTSLRPGGKFEVIPFPPDRKAIDIGDYYGDHSLITQDLDWHPLTTLRQGLERTLDFYLQNRAHYWSD